MLTDENIEKENETLPPSLCFPKFVAQDLRYRQYIRISS